MTQRVKIIVRNEGTEWEPDYVAEWNGEEVRASNPFKLDSMLDNIGAPRPRDLHLED